MTINKKFWEDKIIGWENLRYDKIETDFNLFEKTVDKTNNTLIYRLNFAHKILGPLVKDKNIVELGCGSGFLAKKFLDLGGKLILVMISLKMQLIEQKNYLNILITQVI